MTCNHLFGSGSSKIVLALGALLFSSMAEAMDFSLYGNVALTNRSLETKKSSFMLGAVDLFSSQRVSEKSTAFLELMFDAKAEGYELNVERLWVERALTPTLNIGAGRIHSPLGFWNTNYHHGVFAQDTISRPFFLQFENEGKGLFPNHMVGLFSNSTWTVNDNLVLLQVGLGNGSSLNTSNAIGTAAPFATSNVTDYNASKAMLARASYLDAANHYHLGVFGMINDLAESSASGAASNVSGLSRGERLFDQMVGGMDARYSVDSYYVMGEIFYLRSTDRLVNSTLAPVLASYGSYSYYVQGGWRYQPDITLIGRYEGNTFLSADPYYTLRKIRGEAHYVFAARYDLDDSSALRLEVNQAIPKVGKSETVVTLQWFFLLL